ncbi:hypothetical protein [Streptomyces sp. NPDC058953]|uniref:hypothetical protein n=1 Tax=Streptomyces sp. NPDC058953 TaxID=3346676 RepID=UPI0036B66E87
MASAIVTARDGRPRVVPTAEMVAAFAACSLLSSYTGPPPEAARTVQPGAPDPVDCWATT